VGGVDDAVRILAEEFVALLFEAECLCGQNPLDDLLLCVEKLKLRHQLLHLQLVHHQHQRLLQEMHLQLLHFAGEVEPFAVGFASYPELTIDHY